MTNTNQDLHGGSERRVDFSLSVLFFWVKGSVSVDYRFIKTELANTIFGFIPAGKNRQSIPLKNVSSAEISTSYNVKAFLIGLIIIFIGFGSMSSFLLGLILLVIGVAIFLNGILTILVIQRAGSDFYISVPFYEKQKMMDIQDAIQEALSVDTDKTDLGVQASSLAQANASAMVDAQKKLDEEKNNSNR